MKRFIIQVSLAILIILMQMFCISANAVEVNGNEAQLGQTITYEIHASGCPNIIQAVDVEVTYDSTALEYIPDSIQMPNLTGTLVNDQEKDTIKFNALDLNGFSFYTDNIVATMQFRVISDHAPYLYIKSDIRNFIDDELKDHRLARHSREHRQVERQELVGIAQELREQLDLLGRSLRVDLDVGSLVADAAEDMEARGQPVDEGTEADTLDDAVYFAMEKRHRLATFRRGFILSIIIAVFLASCYMDGGEIRGCWESP